jgi:hypothetical protein
MDQCLDALAFLSGSTEEAREPCLPLLYPSHDARLQRKEIPEGGIGVGCLPAEDALKGKGGEGEKFHNAGAAKIVPDNLKDEP